MFERIGRFVVRHPWWTILAWVLVAGLLVSFAPKVESTNDQADFLPKKYESAKAFEQQNDAFPQGKGETALIVGIRDDEKKLTDEQQQAIKDLAAKLNAEKFESVTSVQAGMLSPNGKVQTANVQFDTSDFASKEMKDAVEDIRHELKQADGDGLTLQLTGNAAGSIDSAESFEESDKITFMATIIVIFVLLLITFRSIIAALMPIVTVFLVMMVAGGLISTMQDAFNLTADDTTSSLLPIVLFGVGTDYILFLLFRYREQLRAGVEKKQAMIDAVHRVGEVIASAAGAVIIAFSALLLAQLGMLRTLGPSMAIAVFTTLLAALTLIPAVVSLLGPKVFWPSKSWRAEPKHTTSARIGGFVSRRPLAVAAVTGLVLIALSIGTLSFKPSFEIAAAPKGTESYDGFENMKKGFPPGAFDATQVLVHSTNGERLTTDQVQDVVDGLDGAEGVGSVTEFDPATGLSEDGQFAQFEVSLANDPQSEKAMDNLADHVKPAAHAAAPEGTEVLVGGTTAIFVDLKDSMNRDYRVVFPVAGLLIAIILAFLLRSLVAPIYLLIAVVLSFTATIGAATFLFQGLLDHSGLLFFMPLVVYLFVVALGTDYNILAIARLREEARAGYPPKEALARAFTHFAPAVASAGLILAGSFATFLLASAAGLQEMGTTVAIGIALSAFVMSMFLVPAITRMLGHSAWWPGHGDAVEKTAAKERERVAAQSSGDAQH